MLVFAYREQMNRNPNNEMPGRGMRGRRQIWWEPRSAAQTAALHPNPRLLALRRRDADERPWVGTPGQSVRSHLNTDASARRPYRLFANADKQLPSPLSSLLGVLVDVLMALTFV